MGNSLPFEFSFKADRLLKHMGNINITDKAISKIQEVLIESQKMKYFRIKVKGGGCSGFQYIFKSDNEAKFRKKMIIFDFNDLKSSYR